MKAILVTRCGCSRMVNTDGYPDHHVPLVSHFTQGLFRDESPAIEAIEWWGTPERRTFLRDTHSEVTLNGEVVAVYREQP